MVAPLRVHHRKTWTRIDILAAKLICGPCKRPQAATTQKPTDSPAGAKRERDEAKQKTHPPPTLTRQSKIIAHYSTQYNTFRSNVIRGVASRSLP